MPNFRAGLKEKTVVGVFKVFLLHRFLLLHYLKLIGFIPIYRSSNFPGCREVGCSNRSE